MIKLDYKQIRIAILEDLQSGYTLNEILRSSQEREHYETIEVNGIPRELIIDYNIYETNELMKLYNLDSEDFEKVSNEDIEKILLDSLRLKGIRVYL